MLKNQKSFAFIQTVIGIVVIAAILFFGVKFITGKSDLESPETNFRNTTYQNQHEVDGFDNKRPFYNQNGIVLSHS